MLFMIVASAVYFGKGCWGFDGSFAGGVCKKNDCYLDKLISSHSMEADKNVIIGDAPSRHEQRLVGDGEPFYDETLKYVENLKNAGVEASVDVYHSDIHAFDMLKPNLEISKKAAKKF